MDKRLTLLCSVNVFLSAVIGGHDMILTLLLVYLTII